MTPISAPLAKRLADKLLSLLLITLLSPLIVLVVAVMAIAMLVSPRDRGSFLYREPRVSAGRVFELLKFRTLRSDVLETMRAEDGHARLYEAEAANLTWAGRHLLKPWYLDELPQLVNVLRGDMSLVGPRAWPPYMVDRQVAEGYDYRNRMLAGLTGPAQVTKGENRRYVNLDLEYFATCQRLGGAQLVRYDLRILRETLRVIARGEGLNY